jgi:hypothetical protein
MQIKITDERIDQIIPVALENIKAEIIEAKEQTFEILDEKGEVILTTLNVIQPGKITTLKDIDAEISDMEMALSNAQTQVESMTIELQKKKDLRTKFETTIRPVFDNLQVELTKKSVATPVEEIMP